MSSDPLFPNPRDEFDQALKEYGGDYEDPDVQWNPRAGVDAIKAEGVRFSDETEELIRDQGMMRLAQDIPRGKIAKKGGRLRAVPSPSGEKHVDYRQLTFAELGAWIERQTAVKRGHDFELDFAVALQREGESKDLLFVSEVGNDRIAEIRAEIAERYAS